uniref:Uncharacterized protein n=1 Tax=Avena sativa TaxID=4498 RepID=A0ACD5Z756_AVESA
MHKARKELAILERDKNGELSPEDYDKVFDDVIAKESTIGGYYDEKYWGDAKLCQGSTSVQGSSSEARVQKELQEMKDDLKRVTGCMERMYAFMARNHPDEDWLKEVMAPGNEIKTGGQPEEDPAPRLQYNNVSVNVISDKVGAGHEVDGVEEPMDNVHTTKSDPKEAQFGNNPTSKDPVNRTGKASTMKESPEHTSHRVNISKGANNVVIHQKVTETAKSNEVVQTLSKKTKCTRAVEDKIHSQNSAHEQRFVKESEVKEISERRTAQKLITT